MDRSVVLDICKHQDPPVPTFILRQGDGESVTLNISIMEDGEAFDLSGCEARFMAQLKGGKVVIDPCEATGGNTLRYTLPSALAAEEGTVGLAYVAVYRGDDWVASTDHMRFEVLKGVDMTAEEAESVLGEFLALKANLDEIVEEAGEQAEAQQAAWEEQMTEQQAEFDRQEEARTAAEEERERNVAEALESLEAAAIVSIPDSDIDALWADY